jgi:hypothetical protein
MSSNGRSIPNIIPPEIRGALLPGPGLSVSQFMDFPLPNISPNSVTNSVNITDYLSDSTPDLKLDQKLLRNLPLPGRAVLEKIHEHLGHLADLCQQKYRSVQYAHLPQSSRLTKLPVWVFVYWVEVFLLRKHVREPWTKAEEWLRSQRNRFRAGAKRDLCDKASRALLTLPWAGNVHGFSDDSPTAKLATYLSRQWLGSVHMDQQFDMLRRDVIRSIADAKCEIMDTSFFIKLCQVYRERLQKPYHAETPGARRLWRVGEELAAGIRTKVGGGGNINSNHWISYILQIDSTQINFLYGDSFGSEPPNDVAAAFKWWITTHVKYQYLHRKLAISPQTDSHSCGVLSPNAVAHFVLPENVELVAEKDADEARIALFVRVTTWDLESVSSTCMPQLNSTSEHLT